MQEYGDLASGAARGPGGRGSVLGPHALDPQAGVVGKGPRLPWGEGAEREMWPSFRRGEKPET